MTQTENIINEPKGYRKRAWQSQISSQQDALCAMGSIREDDPGCLDECMSSLEFKARTLRRSLNY